jgi:hypothetical protein
MYAELRTFAHPGYAGDKPNSRPPIIATTVQAGLEVLPPPK